MPEICPGVMQWMFSWLVYLAATGPVVPNLHDMASSWTNPYPDTKISEPPMAGPVTGDTPKAAVLPETDKEGVSGIVPG